MNCEQARDLAALAASGDVTPFERQALELHAAGCEECRLETDAFGELYGQMAAMREMCAPPHVYAAVRSRVVAEIRERQRPGWVAVWGAFAAVVACTVVLAVTFRQKAPVITRPVQHPAAAATVASIPDDAPVTIRPVQEHRVRRQVVRAVGRDASDPLVVHMFTDDPDVVIYWIADAGRSNAKKETIQ